MEEAKRRYAPSSTSIDTIVFDEKSMKAMYMLHDVFKTSFNYMSAQDHYILNRNMMAYLADGGDIDKAKDTMQLALLFGPYALELLDHEDVKITHLTMLNDIKHLTADSLQRFWGFSGVKRVNGNDPSGYYQSNGITYHNWLVLNEDNIYNLDDSRRGLLIDVLEARDKIKYKKFNLKRKTIDALIEDVLGDRKDNETKMLASVLVLLDGSVPSINVKTITADWIRDNVSTPLPILVENLMDGDYDLDSMVGFYDIFNKFQDEVCEYSTGVNPSAFLDDVKKDPETAGDRLKQGILDIRAKCKNITTASTIAYVSMFALNGKNWKMLRRRAIANLENNTYMMDFVKQMVEDYDSLTQKQLSNLAVIIDKIKELSKEDRERLMALESPTRYERRSPLLADFDGVISDEFKRPKPSSPFALSAKAMITELHTALTVKGAFGRFIRLRTAIADNDHFQGWTIYNLKNVIVDGKSSRWQRPATKAQRVMESPFGMRRSNRISKEELLWLKKGVVPLTVTITNPDLVFGGLYHMSNGFYSGDVQKLESMKSEDGSVTIPLFPADYVTDTLERRNKNQQKRWEDALKA